MILKNFEEFLNESLESERLDSFISDTFRNSNDNEVIGKLYLMKSPNGKPMLYRCDKLHKASSIYTFGIMEYGKVAGNPEFYISWNKRSSTGKISKLDISVINYETAKRLLDDISVNSNNIPKTLGINSKEISGYIIVK